MDQNTISKGKCNLYGAKPHHLVAFGYSTSPAYCIHFLRPGNAQQSIYQLRTLRYVTRAPYQRSPDADRNLSLLFPAPVND